MTSFTNQQKLDALGVSDEFILQELKKYEITDFTHKEVQILKTWIADNFELEELESETISENENQRLILTNGNKVIHVRPLMKNIPYKKIFEMSYALAHSADERWWAVVMIMDVLYSICCRELSVDEIFVHTFLEDYCLNKGHDFIDEGIVMEIAASYSEEKQYRYLTKTELERVLHDLKERHLINRKDNKIYPVKQLKWQIGVDNILI